jgi:citrate lyase subunit beta/citryl-CoA lyase
LPLSPLRSILFAPGTRPDLFDKAFAAGPDAVVLDLEDSVPPPRRSEARANVAAALARGCDRLTFIRINHPQAGALEQDLAVLAPHPTQAVMVPKVDGPADLAEIDERLGALEAAAGLPAHAVSLMVVIETALGLRNLYDTLCAMPRVRAAGLATAEEGDLMVDLGAQWTTDGQALAYARGRFVCDGRAAGVALYDGAFTNIRDREGLEQECRLARRLGFDGKVAIHPRQLDAIHAAFAVSERELERARRIIAAFRAAEAEGQGVVQVDGKMVDYANVRQAERILAQAGSFAGPRPNAGADL